MFLFCRWQISDRHIPPISDVVTHVSCDFLRCSRQSLGIIQLKTLLKMVCANGHCTHHYSKRTCASQFYSVDFAEQVLEVMEHKGHRFENTTSLQSNEILEIFTHLLKPLTGQAKRSNIEVIREHWTVNRSNGSVTTDVTMSNERVLIEMTEQTVFQNCQIAFNFLCTD